MTIGIVILNYLNWNDTVECIESLRSQTNKDIEVVVVDNCSNNGSFEKLSQLYENENHIHVLLSETNLGFAKGNNLGIVFCKEELDINNILVVNNDVIFTDDDYLAVLSNYDYGKDIGAIGTKIIGSDNKNQNPVYLNTSLYNIVKHLVEPYLRERKFGKILDQIRAFVQTIKKITNDKKNLSSTSDNGSTKNKESFMPVKENYLLHGAAIYFTENYLNDMNGFYPGTFLYYEENILGVIFTKLDLKMQYIDNIKIYHKEDQSSNLSFSNSSTVKKGFIRKSIKTAIKVKLSNIKSIKKYTNNYEYKYTRA